MINKLNKSVVLSLAAVSSMALPIDWHGELQTDMHMLQNYNRSVFQGAPKSGAADGDQAYDPKDADEESASFQNYIFKLQPSIIVNDSTTINAELTSGYGYGGNFGDSNNNGKVKGGDSYANARYSFNTVTDNPVNLTQAYATFFSDTATYIVGRQKVNWGLGAIYNDGSEAGSHFASIRDGITVDFKIGNFKFSPYYARIQSDNLTETGKISELGISMLYENLDREFTFGVLYTNNKAGKAADRKSSIDAAVVQMGEGDISIADIYLRKSFGDYTLEAEVPIMSGDLGEIYTSKGNASVTSAAYLLNNTFKINTNNTVHLNLGMVDGSEAMDDEYNAMYLNPNFQIANIMFRYNIGGIIDGAESVFDSSIVNTTFIKASHVYNTGTWAWTNSLIWAKANEVASAGQDAINHEKNKRFTAAADQDDDLGIEFDSNFMYKWNTSVTLNANFGYFLVGDYYAFSNTATPNETNDSYLLYLGANIKF